MYKSYKLTQIIVEINMAVATIGKLQNKTKKHNRNLMYAYIIKHKYKFFLWFFYKKYISVYRFAAREACVKIPTDFWFWFDSSVNCPNFDFKKTSFDSTISMIWNIWIDISSFTIEWNEIEGQKMDSKLTVWLTKLTFKMICKIKTNANAEKKIEPLFVQ